MEFVGWIVSGGFKYSLTASNGIDKTIGFALVDSILINYESLIYSKEMQTDLIALEDSEVLVVPSRQIGDILRSDAELNSHLILTLYEQLYDPFLDFYTNSPTQRFVKLREHYPHITDIASYGDIASYLNISRRQHLHIRENNFLNS